MATETEVKFLEINRKQLETKLRKLNAKKIFDCIIEISFFDYPNKKIRKEKQVLRIRKINGKSKLTFKIPLKAKKVKSVNELEVEVSDFNETRKILLAAGLKEFLKVKKRRIRYKTKDCQFEFDNYLGKFKHIPEFLEIEANKKTIKKYQKLLNLKNPKPYDFFKLIDYYKK